MGGVFKYWMKSILTVLVLAALLQARPAHGLACGDEVRTDLVLTADLGPCPGRGLLLTGPTGGATSQTLNLNGHRIIGSGTSTGLQVEAGGPLIIKGPGRITNFATGISFRGIFGESLVYDLTLVNNATGISAVQQGGLRVVDNTIKAGQNGQVGLFLAEVGTSYFYRNAITGHSLAGVSIQATVSNQSSALGMTTNLFTDPSVAPVISENTITQNQTGILTFRDDADAVIRGNQISHNVLNGIQVKSVSTTSYVIEDNVLDANGQSGIVLGPSSSSGTWRIQNNVIKNHPVYGISAEAGNPTITLAGNRLSRNGTDFHWDSIGTVCWLGNIFATSDPVSLPVCSPRF